MLARSFDVERINAIVNDPTVRPTLGGGDVELDVGPFVERPEHLFLLGEHGGFWLAWSAPQAREVHTFILPKGRGSWAKQAARAGIAFAAETGDKLLWTKVDPEHRHTALFARIMGMRSTGVVIETLGRPMNVYSMEIGSCQ